MAKGKKPTRRRIQKSTAPKKCFFCVEKKEPAIEDIGSLTRFLTERGKIMPRSRNGLCAKHQKKLSISIKHARHLALISFVVRV